MNWFTSAPLFDKFLMIVAGGMIGASAFTAAHIAFEDTRVPIKVYKIETLNSPVCPGDTLHLRLWREKVRDCPLISVREATNADGETYNLGSYVPPERGVVGAPTVDLHYTTPHDIPPGNYLLRAVTTYYCPDGAHQVELPVARFRVLSKAGADEYFGGNWSGSACNGGEEGAEAQ